MAARPFFSAFGHIRDHLGYRLEIVAASFPRAVPRSGSFAFAADIVNYVFAAPVNPRPVQLVLLRQRAEVVWRSAESSASLSNPVEWRPRVQFDPTYQLTSHRIGGTFTLPATPTGNLALVLVLPDVRQHLFAHRGSIRLANTDTEWLVVGNVG